MLFVSISINCLLTAAAAAAAKSLQSCPTIHDPMDCSLPGSSSHGIFQSRVLEWVAIAFFVLTRHVEKNSNFATLNKKNLAFNSKHGYRDDLHFIFVTANQSLVSPGWVQELILSGVT